MDAQAITALRNGARIDDARLEALRTFARALVVERGNIAQAQLDAFLGAGYTPENALEVVLGLAVKVMSNYTNSIAGTPLDKEVEKLRWRKPRIAMRTTD